MHNRLQSAIKNVLHRHKHQPKSWEQLQTELSQLQHQANRVVQLQKDCILLERQATQRLKGEMERDRTAAPPPTQQQSDVQPMTAQEVYELSKHPDKFSQFIKDHEQELIHLIR